MGYTSKYKKMANEEYTPKETVKDVLTYPILEIKERNLSKETCEVFGIRTGLSELDGTTPVAHYFPYYNQKGEIVGFKKRDLTKGKEERGHFSAIGNVSINCQMFGQTLAASNKRKRSKLYVCEGEYDAPSLYQAIVESVANTSYAGLKPFVVSVSLGTSNAVESILHNKDFVGDFEQIALCFDNDECTPKEKEKGVVKGREAREQVANALLGMNITYLPFEMGMKDPSDYLQAGRAKDLAQMATFGLKPYVAEKVVKASDIPLEEILEARPEGLYVDQFPGLMRKIHGFRTRELVLLTAPSGCGKSTVSSIFAASFMQAGERVGMIYLEEQNKETLQRMIAAKLRVNYLEFKNNPLGVASREDITKAYQEIAEDDKVVMLNHFGSLPISELMSKVKHMYFVEKCRYILLDHLSVVISGSAITDERKELDIVMTELAAFCAANDVCVIAISHINRSNADAFKAPKGKEDQPFWVRVTKESLRGSAALEQLSFIIIGIEPEILPDRSRGRARLCVLKNRPWGYLGVADTFHLDENTWDVLVDDSDVTEF